MWSEAICLTASSTAIMSLCDPSSPDYSCIGIYTLSSRQSSPQSNLQSRAHGCCVPTRESCRFSWMLIIKGRVYRAGLQVSSFYPPAAHAVSVQVVPVFSHSDSVLSEALSLLTFHLCTGWLGREGGAVKRHRQFRHNPHVYTVCMLFVHPHDPGSAMASAIWFSVSWLTNS